ncbi:MAG: tRNA (adenosine(37)-N6)-dimethylallyltransferase MiaA [Cyanobacteria bacterium TGS_CYA1]|nr:tRNA (adenosine(37)-N6)-dimethylallyltransferase MiaA [Cyanobacteria bacterium TGS_CYA1]
MKKGTVLALVGPTCSSKTDLSIGLAKKLDCEIIACDSRTVYKYMDIGTAKPTLEQRQAVPHHLLDIVEPNQVYTAAQFKNDAGLILEDQFNNKNKNFAIVCGGTGFYAKALLSGLAIPEVPPQEQLREELRKRAQEFGIETLYSELEKTDPDAAKKIGQNDLFRIVRALEVSQYLGIPFSKAAVKKEVPYNVIWIGLTFDDRSILKQRIIERLAEQSQGGLLAEVRSLYEKYGPCQTLMNAVGYKEIIEYIDGKTTFDAAIENCVKHTYQLARKQLIFFRAIPDIVWFSVDQEKNLLEAVQKHMSF